MVATVAKSFGIISLLGLVACGSGELEISVGECAGQAGCISTIPAGVDSAGAVLSAESPALPSATTPVEVQFVTKELRVREDIGQAVLLVWLSALAPEDVTVRILAGGDAEPEVDYRWDNATVTIPAGEIVRSIQVPILDNANADATRRVQFFLAEPDHATLAAPALLTLTIVDNDGAAEAVDLAVPINAARALGAASATADFGGGGGCSLNPVE